VGVGFYYTLSAHGEIPKPKQSEAEALADATFKNPYNAVRVRPMYQRLLTAFRIQLPYYYQNK
jgi:hypothetical protein